MSDNYEKILNGEISSGAAANLVELLEDKTTALESQVKALTEKNEGLCGKVAGLMAFHRAVADEATGAGMSPSAQLTLIRQAFIRIDMDLSKIAADFLAKRDREVEARVWREAMLLSEQKLDDQYNVVYKVC